MEPSPGMIVFFDWDNKGNSGLQDGQSDHVGIVQKVENGVVYTIEATPAIAAASISTRLAIMKFSDMGCRIRKANSHFIQH